MKELNYGQCYYLQPLTLRDLARLDLAASASAFGGFFSNPAEWTFAFVGALDDGAEALIVRYLGSLPAAPAAPPPRRVEDLTPLPWAFPSRPQSREARSPSGPPACKGIRSGASVAAAACSRCAAATSAPPTLRRCARRWLSRTAAPRSPGR